MPHTNTHAVWPLGCLLALGSSCREINPVYLGPPGQESSSSETIGTSMSTATSAPTTESTTALDTSSSTGPDIPPCTDDPDLVVCLEFESFDAGVFADGSVWENDAIGDMVEIADGVSGMAAELSETSTLSVPDASSLDLLSAMTIELWLRPDVVPLSGQNPPDPPDWLMDKTNYALELRPGGSVRCHFANENVTGFSLTEQNWTHIACVYDGETLTLFADGFAGRPSEAANANIGSLDEPLQLGNRLSTDAPYQGRVDSFRIWRVARTREEICQDGGIDPC